MLITRHISDADDYHTILLPLRFHFTPSISAALYAAASDAVYLIAYFLPLSLTPSFCAAAASAAPCCCHTLKGCDAFAMQQPLMPPPPRCHAMPLLIYASAHACASTFADARCPSRRRAASADAAAALLPRFLSAFFTVTMLLSAITPFIADCYHAAVHYRRRSARCSSLTPPPDAAITLRLLTPPPPG